MPEEVDRCPFTRFNELARRLPSSSRYKNLEVVPVRVLNLKVPEEVSSILCELFVKKLSP